MSPAIIKLPNELTSYIAQYLDVEDLFNLSLSCRRFQDIVRDDNICRRVLKENASYSSEYMSAHSHRMYARALRLLVKRRHAISSAQPYLAAVVAVAESFLYVNGTLIYILNRRLRILDLHHSSATEIVVDIRTLLDASIPEFEGTTKYKVHLVHFADGFLSCRCTSKPNTQNWLLVYHIHKHTKASIRLDSPCKLFVRNNRQYLFYGTHSEVGDDGFRRWVLGRYCIESRTWFDYKIHLSDMAGSDIGSTICFEIFDDWLYGLSNQTRPETEAVDWTSHYHCFRLPLANPRPDCTQVPSKTSLWRRHHVEGPIDDRWNFLRLEKDEASGILKVVESRKEWRSGNSSSRRTYYTQELIFPPDNNNGEGPVPGITNNGITDDVGGSVVGQVADNEGNSGASQPEEENGVTPDTLDMRLPQNVHPGDDSTYMVVFNHRKIAIRSYYSTCSTFLDMVDDPSPKAPDTQRVRIRVGSRRLRRSPETREEPDGDPLYPSQEIKRLYQTSRKSWPPENDANQYDPRLDELASVLNPPSHQGNLLGTWDERSLLYATGHAGDLRALVFISFDSSIRLAGMKSWRGGKCVDGFQEDQPPHAPAAEGIGKANQKEALEYPADDRFNTATGDCRTQSQGDASASGKARTWNEPAMYSAIASGFDFSL